MLGAGGGGVWLYASGLWRGELFSWYIYIPASLYRNPWGWDPLLRRSRSHLGRSRGTVLLTCTRFHVRLVDLWPWDKQMDLKILHHSYISAAIPIWLPNGVMLLIPYGQILRYSIILGDPEVPANLYCNVAYPSWLGRLRELQYIFAVPSGSPSTCGCT